MKDKIIAVDLGGTNLRVSLVNNNKIIKYIKNKTPKHGKEIIDLLFKTIEHLMDKDIKGIGVASPGPLKDGIIKNPPNIALKNYNLEKELRSKFKKKTVINNDVHCVALAESKLGCRKKNFIVIALGTGVGGGIVINGEIYSGQGFAGEVGGITLDNGKSFEKLWQESREIMKEKLGKEMLVKDLIKMNSPESNVILDNMIRYLGQGIASVINIFDPEVIILNGGLKEAGEAFLKMIRKEVKKYSVLPKETPIKWSNLEHPGILGASLLIK